MPNVQHNSQIDARRFAALLAGFDLGNASEEEAVNKGRALRRMAAQANMRIVDVLELPNVRKAVDDQLHPARGTSPELQEAIESATALRQELIERTRDVRQLAEALRRQEETSDALRRELAASSGRRGSHSASASPAPSFGAQSWVIEAGAVLLAMVLSIGSVVGGHFLERSNGNELGNGKRVSAPLVRKGRAVLPLSKRGALHHRLHSGGPTTRTR